MEPEGDEGLARRRLALGDLVLMVREYEVNSSGMDVEGRAEIGHAHGRALDVPARPSRSDGRIPAGLFVLGPLPESEVADVILAVLVRLDSLADAHPLGIESGQSTVGRPGCDPEEDRAVVSPIGMAAFEQLLDQRHHLGNVLGRTRHHVRRGHAERLCVGEEELLVARSRFPRWCRLRLWPL